MEVFGRGAATCFAEDLKAQDLEIPDAGVLFLCFPLALIHFHPRILQTVMRHLVKRAGKTGRRILQGEGERIGGGKV